MYTTQSRSRQRSKSTPSCHFSGTERWGIFLKIFSGCSNLVKFGGKKSCFSFKFLVKKKIKSWWHNKTVGGKAPGVNSDSFKGDGFLI